VIDVFENFDGSVSFRLHFAPGNIPEARMAQTLHCASSDQPFTQMSQGVVLPDVVKSAGVLIYNALSSHPAVKMAITQAMTIPTNAVTPIYLQLDSAPAQEVPWETLNADGCFLALGRWPVGRIADTSTRGQEIRRIFEPPLTIVAILAAARDNDDDQDKTFDATPEWEAIYAGVKNQPQLLMRVFVCQDDLKAAIEALNDERIDVRFLTNQTDIFDAINELSPHILHFYCHGSTLNGPHLELATRQDWLAGNQNGSIVIQPTHLRLNTKMDRTNWLMVLNCCEGGATVGEAHSLAGSLVTEGFPAVIGMREVIATTDAHRFCKALYPAILEEIDQCLNSGQSEVEWSKVLRRPREELCKARHPGALVEEAAIACKEWTLPIIYVRPEAFTLQRGRPTNPALTPQRREELRAKIAKLREGHTALALIPGLPKSALDEVEAQIKAAENELYV
jgi:hypothetical protein